MRKNNKKTQSLAILTACMLILVACGKSEEEKAVDEIYSHLDAEEQANVDKAREEIANYEAEKKAEAEANEAAKEVDYMDVLTEWELGKDMQRCPNPYGYGSTLTNEDFSNSLSILYPDKEYVKYSEIQTGFYVVEPQSSYVLCCYYFTIKGKPSRVAYIEEEIGNYTVAAYDWDTFGSEVAVYDKALDKSIVTHIIIKSNKNEELVSKNYDFIVEQVKSWEQNETTDEEITAEESVQGEIPYGNYKCSENGKSADINIEDGEFNVIMFEDTNTASGVEGMYDIIWIEGSTYSIELGDRFGTATIDASGNMQVTANNDELKPYEGYYTKAE